jgi:hypothetical protein
MRERPQQLALDLLESYAREQDIDVSLERWKSRSEWACLLTRDAIVIVVGTGRTARAAITDALGQAGVDPFRTRTGLSEAPASLIANTSP